jgi:hypothetical protein
MLTEVGKDSHPYPSDACWAEPDLDVAASAMRELYDQPEMAKALGERGAASVTAAHDVSSAAGWFEKEFALLAGGRS